MAFLKKLFNFRSFTSVPSDFENPQEWLLGMFGGNTTSSGEKVNGDTAILNSNVYTCAAILGGDIGKLPINVYRFNKNGKEQELSHPVVQLLSISPNPYMTAYVFKELLLVNLVTWGNAFAYIEWDAHGFPKALWPMLPNSTQMVIDMDTMEPWYLTTFLNGETRKIPYHDVIHLKMLSRNGLLGISPISVVREEIGVQQAQEKFIGSFYANGTTTRGILKTDASLNSDAKNKAREEWQKLNTGLTNAQKIAVMDNGLDYKSMGMPLADAQFIETRKMGILEIAKIYKIPAHKLNQLDRSTFSNIEQQSLDYVKSTLQPYITQIEQELVKKLFTEKERKRYFAKFDVASELRGDSQSRATYLKTLVEGGIISVNEARKEIDYSNIGEAGDKHAAPLNFTTLEAMNEQPVQQTTEEPKTPPKGGEVINGEGNTTTDNSN